MQTILVTGAAGFIGSAVCRYLRREGLANVVGVDAMTYAASRESVGILANDPLFNLIVADVTDAAAMAQIMVKVAPDSIIHLAAETHVDRSIDGPSDFLRSNVVGTFSLLETVRNYMPYMTPKQRESFRFLHVSTDEIYGSLGPKGRFTETTPFAPSSPYAATKAASDLLVYAWNRTYGLPIIISNCSNNYGPLQFPEKLLPLTITKAINGEPIPVYGKGENVRDWLFVEDHARALYAILQKGRVGERYNVGGNCEKRNIDVVTRVCELLDEMSPNARNKPHSNLITYVDDRPGHDFRYAMDFTKLTNELGWKPQTSLEDGLRQTISWYLSNQIWCNAIRARKYGGERLGRKT